MLRNSAALHLILSIAVSGKSLLLTWSYKRSVRSESAPFISLEDDAVIRQGVPAQCPPQGASPCSKICLR